MARSRGGGPPILAGGECPLKAHRGSAYRPRKSRNSPAHSRRDVTDNRVGFLESGGVMAVLRLPSADALLPAAEALREGGVTAIEVTPNAPSVLEALNPARVQFGHDLLPGVGSILTVEAAHDAIQAGAAFVAAPNLNPEVIQVCQKAGVPVIPGAFTATEILQAWNLGVSLVKVFPAGLTGAGYIREILFSLPSLRLMAAGGISLANAGEFIRAGAVMVAVGDEIASREALERREFSEVTRRARAFVEAVRQARGQVARRGQPVRPIEGPDTR